MAKKKEDILSEKPNRNFFIPELKTSEILDLIHDAPQRELKGYSLFDLQDELDERLPFIGYDDHLNDLHEDLILMNIELREVVKRLYNHVHRGDNVYTAG